MARKRVGWPEWVWIVILFGGFSAAMLSIGFWMVRLQGAGLELRNANPEWRVDKSFIGLQATHKSSGAEVFMTEEIAGPVPIERVACAEAQKEFPVWFRLPPGEAATCVRLGSAPPYTIVLNHRTALAIPALWNEVYDPTVRELALDVSGEWFTLSGNSADPNNRAEPGEPRFAAAPGGGGTQRAAHWLRYYIEDPKDAQRRVILSAFYYGDTTLVVAALAPSLR
jgi:hypothetical protein